MRNYNEKDCRCPRHASHYGCEADSYQHGTPCICAPSAITEAAYTPMLPEEVSYFERTFRRQLDEAKRTGRRAF